MHLQHAHKLFCMDHISICLKAEAYGGLCGGIVKTTPQLAFALSMAANEM